MAKNQSWLQTPGFRPLPRGDTSLLYHWDGERIDRYWDYGADRWIMTGIRDGRPSRP